MHEFTLVTTESGDWTAMYMDGRLMAEGHNLHPRDVLDALANVFPNKVVSAEISDEAAEEWGSMPQNLNDLWRDI